MEKQMNYKSQELEFYYFVASCSADVIFVFL